MSENKSSVLVVGCGVTGLTAALVLVKSGINVRIIHKDPEFWLGIKGSGIMPKNLELHKFLGTLDDILDLAGPIPFQKIYGPDGKTARRVTSMGQFGVATSGMPFPNAVQIPQDVHEGILRRHLESLGVSVETGTVLESFEQHSDHVIAHIAKQANGNTTKESTKYDFIIGADGAHSVVRKGLGSSFLGETREEKIVVGDIVLKSGLERGFWHRWGNLAVRGAGMRSYRKTDRFMINLAGKELDYEKVTSSRDELIKAFHEITGRTDIEFGELNWVSIWRPNIRMVDSFGKGRVFIAGDAAHIHSPTGGQGLNTGMQDAVNLAWKVALVAKGAAPLSLLNSYNEERLPIIAAMLDKTTALFNAIAQSAIANKVEPTWKRERDLTQLYVTIRGSSHVYDEAHPVETIEKVDPYRSGEVGGLHAGDRAPDAPGLVPIYGPAISSFFSLFTPTAHTILLFSPTEELVKSVASVLSKYKHVAIQTAAVIPAEANLSAEGLDHVLQDEGGYAQEAYKIVADGYNVIVVRPDAFIGAIAKGAEGLQKYFEKILVAQ